MSTNVKTVSGLALKVTMRDGDKPATWDDNQPHSHNHSRVTISAGSSKHTFDFWGSVHDYWKGQDNDPADALTCWASDALSGQYDFDEFCSELGYDTDSRQAYKTWKACQKAADAAQRLGLTDDDLYDLYNR